MSVPFDLTFELANMLNGEPSGSTSYVPPSEQGFEWNVNKLNKFSEKLRALQEALKFNRHGDAHESEKDIEHWENTVYEKGEWKLPVAKLTDILYGDLFYYSDRWCNGRMARIAELYRHIEKQWGLENDAERYLKTGDLSPGWFVQEAEMWDYNLKHGGHKRPIHYSEKVEQAFRRILKDLADIGTMLKSIKGKPLEECPFDKKVRGKRGYTFRRLNYLGKHAIDIGRGKDHLYWTIIADSKEHEIDERAPIYGYWHRGTNGNMKDLKEALECLSDFFPEVTV